MQRLCLIVAISLILGCSLGKPQSILISQDPPETINILEIVLRIAIEDSYKNALPFEVIFVSVGSDQDPNEELLRRLAVYRNPVLPFSQCKKIITLREVNEYEYIERKTKKRGIVIFASVEWMDTDTVKVSYGWDQYKLAVRIKSAEMKKVNNKWVISKLGYEIMT